MVLFIPDNSKSCVVERCFDTLEVLIGAKTGVDLTSNRALGGMPITESGELWTWEYNSGVEAAYMTDEDDATLKVLQCLDVSPTAHLTDSPIEGTVYPQVAVRVGEIVCVPGLAYSFFGRHIVGGQGHGIALVDGAEEEEAVAFPRSRTGSTGALYRRHLGASDEEGYDLVDENGFPIDEHSHWGTSAQPVLDDDAERTIWEYFIREGDEYLSFGRFATRELAVIQVTVSGGGGARCLHVDRFGNIHRFQIDNTGALMYDVKRWLPGVPWTDPVQVLTVTGSPVWVDAEKDGRGCITVVWAESRGPVMVARTRDDGQTMTEDSVGIELDWTHKKMTVMGGLRFVVGFDDDDSYWKCVRCMQTENTLVPFPNGEEVQNIAAGVDGDFGLTSVEGILLADLPIVSETETTLYLSQDGGQSWSADA